MAAIMPSTSPHPGSPADRSGVVRREIAELAPPSRHLRAELLLDPASPTAQGPLRRWANADDVSLPLATADQRRRVRNALLARGWAAFWSAGGLADDGPLPGRAYGRHQLATAVAAEQLAVQLDRGDLLRWAFPAGLLLNVGQAALAASFPRSYARVVAAVEADQGCVCTLEHEQFGCDHATIGRQLAARWALPAPIAQAIWLHHHAPSELPPDVPHRDILAIAYAADHLARGAQLGFDGYGYTEPPSDLAVTTGLPATLLEELRRQLPTKTKTWLELAAAPAESKASARTAAALPAEPDDWQQQCLQAAAQVAVHAATAPTLEEACAVAARAVQEALPVAGVVVAVSDVSGMWHYVGLAEPGVRRPVGRCLAGDALLGQAEGRTAAVLHALDRPALAGEAWTELPLPFDNEGAGLLALNRLDVAIDDDPATPSPQRLLAASVAAALTATRTRLDLERGCDDLLAAHRRARTAQAQQVRQRTVSAVSEMAAGAAHEINNPLAVISGRAQMLLADCSDPALARSLQIIADQAKDAAQIVLDLMDFAKPPAPRPALARLADLLSAVRQHWQQRCSLSDEQLVLRVADPAVTVFADLEQLREIVSALLANALDATSEKTARVLINSPSRASDETVRMMIEDNGVGMSPAVLEHALDPFFSHRPAGRGRGLGLSRAYRLAVSNGGSLQLRSRPGEGTMVTVTLPARPPAATA